MTGPELKAIRERLGLTQRQMGRALGYQGSDLSTAASVGKMECGLRPVPIAVARLAFMYGKHGVPKRFLA